MNRPGARPVVWALIIFGWCQLFADTVRIRPANLDDLNFQRVVTAGKMGDYLSSWGPIQGRFYGWFAFGPIWALDLVQPQWLFQVLRLGLVAVMIGMLAMLAWRVSGSARLVQLWLLIWIGCLQISPMFYGLLSYPALHCGMILILAGALTFWRTLQSQSGKTGLWMSAGFFFAGLQFNESFLAFLALFLGLLVWHDRALSQPVRFRLMIPFVAACAAYVAIYIAYRETHPPLYEGTQAGGSVVGALLYLFRYGASSLPGFELVIDRDVQHPAFIKAAEVFGRIEGLNPWRLPWVVAVGAGTYSLLNVSPEGLPRRQMIGLGLLSTAMGLLFLSVPSVSAKYQVFAYRRFYPHAYNFISVTFCWLGVAALAIGLVGIFSGDLARRRTAAAVLSVGIGTAALMAQISNPLALQEIRQTISNASVTLPP